MHSYSYLIFHYYFFLFICSLSAGEVFVHRNVGNLIPGNDLNALSVLEFAVEHLNVTDIIVTGRNSTILIKDDILFFLYTDNVSVWAGHYDCGAVKAAVKRQDLGLLENWLRQIRDVYRLHQEYLDEHVVCCCFFHMDT